MSLLISSDIKLPFRTIRIGSFRTYPVKVKTKVVANPKHNWEFEHLLLCEKEITFIVATDKDCSNEVSIKISTKRIHYVDAFLSRGCPVLWIKPDKVCAEKIRAICNMTNRRGPYLDPDSEAAAENYIAVIIAQDPLPFALSHSIQTIFQNIARNRKIKPEKFFVTIKHNENNDRLVQYTVFMDNIESQKSKPEIKANSKKAVKGGKKAVVRQTITSSEEESDDNKVEEPEDDEEDRNFNTKIKTRSVPLRNIQSRKCKTTAAGRDKDEPKPKRKVPAKNKRKTSKR